MYDLMYYHRPEEEDISMPGEHIQPPTTGIEAESHSTEGVVVRYISPDEAATYAAPAGKGVPYVAVSNPENPGPELYFDRPEWEAFLAGVRNGEFDQFG